MRRAMPTNRLQYRCQSSSAAAWSPAWSCWSQTLTDNGSDGMTKPRQTLTKAGLHCSRAGMAIPATGGSDGWSDWRGQAVAGQLRML